MLVGSSSAGTAYNNSGANLLLGINKGDGSGYFDGKMQDVRYYHAVKYTSDFIPASTDPNILPDTPSGVSYGSQLTKVPVTDGSVYFDGTSDSLTFETSSDLSLDGDFTIEFWAYPDSIAGDPQGSDPSPITMPTDGSSITQVFIWANNLQYTLHKSTAIVSTANGTAATKRWQHVAFTRSGTTVYAFFDGVLQNTATSSATFGGAVTISHATPQFKSIDTDGSNDYSTFQNSSGQSVYNAVDNNTHGKHLFQTAGTERARIDASGRLLIATSTSATINSGDAVLQVKTTSKAISILQAESDDGGGNIDFGKSRGGAVVQSGDNIGNIFWNAHDGTD